MASQPYFLGCPVWSCPGWRGNVFPPRTHQREWLKYYSRRFNTVEGNSTFYAIPSRELAQRWAEQTSDGFRFALKFPRSISHDKQLVGAERERNQFLEVLDLLSQADRLGPTFLQLSPHFGPRQFPALEAFLRQLPPCYPYALELRHADFFEEPVETEINQLLESLNIDRVVFDSRPLFSRPPLDSSEQQARHRKPQMPIRTNATGNFPILRLIGLNHIDDAKPWVEDWSQHITAWIETGKQPFVFAHTPDDRYAPDMAALIHQYLQAQRGDLEPLPESVPARQRQLNLF